MSMVAGHVKLSHSCLNETLQVHLPFLFRELLYGVPEHRPGHSFVVLLQESFFGMHVSIADFPQHPSNRFMDEIFPVFEKNFRDPERIREIVPSYEILR